MTTGAFFRLPDCAEQHILQRLEVRLLGSEGAERDRYRQLVEEHHYLKSDSLVGEQLRYVAQCEGQWLALLSWSAAAKHLRDREQWIGWTAEQRRRRLALLANNARFLILPGVDCPNLASRALALCSARLSRDWQETYGHPVLVLESFVDSQLFRGTCYKAQGWRLLGQTRGFERCRQDYYTEHGRPKQLWVRALHPHSLHWLSSETLPEDLQSVADQIVPQPLQKAHELRGLVELCRQVPDWRKRKGLDYPLPCVLAIIVLANLCGVVRGQRDLAAFAAGLSQAQLRALRSYRRADGSYEYPKETTFQRVLANVDALIFEQVLHQWQDQLLGRESLESDRLVAIDGKAQRGSSPQSDDAKKPQLVTAQSLPSGRVLGTEAVAQKSNEIPAARRLLERIGPLDGKLVMLDALHTNQPTLSQIQQDNGADYLLPVKGNHQGLEKRAAACLPPGTVFEPTQTLANVKTKAGPAAAGLSPLATGCPLCLPPRPCAIAVSEEVNRSRLERRTLRWVAASAQSLCCAGVRSVAEVTREVTILRGKDKGKSTRETVLYVSTLEFDPPRVDQLLGFVRLYWDIEGGLHQRLDVTACEDASRVRNPNAILVLGIARRATFGLYRQWRGRRKNPRQSTLRDFHDAMDHFNHRLAFSHLQPQRI